MITLWSKGMSCAIIANLAGIALFLFADMATFHSCMESLAFQGMGPSFSLAFFGGNAAVRIGVFALKASTSLFSERRQPSIRPAASLAMMAAACVLGASAVSGSSASEAMGWVSGALAGAAFAIMWVFWMSSLAEYPFKESCLLLLGSHLLSIAITAFVLLVASKAWLGCAVCAYLVSLVLASKHRMSPKPSEKPLDSLRLTVPLLWEDVLLVGLFMFLGGLVSTVAWTGGATSALDQQWAVLGIQLAAAAVLVVPLVAFRTPLTLEMAYRLAFPLAGAAFFVLAGIAGKEALSAARPLILMGQMITGVIFHCTACEVARQAKVSTAFFIAFGDGVGLVLLCAGTAVAQQLPAWTSQNYGAYFALLGAFMLVFGVISWSMRLGIKESVTFDLVTRQKQRPIAKYQKEELKDPALPADAGPATGMHADQGAPTKSDEELTDLDKQIFAMIVGGNTTRVIANTLFLSQSAVKYHISKIFRKHGVHSRTELLEIMERQTKANRIEAKFSKFGEVHGLSGRETDLLACLVKGFSTPLAARTLGISENTAKTHVKRIYAKLGLHTRQELVEVFSEWEHKQIFMQASSNNQDLLETKEAIRFIE